MDFTDAYRLQCCKAAAGPSRGQRPYAYSPGSTFYSTLHHLPDSGETIVQVRVSTSLQIIRTWTLDFLGSTVSWSQNGALILVVGKGRLVVLAVDPSAMQPSTLLDFDSTMTTEKSITRLAEQQEGVVFSIRAGWEGLAGAYWVGRATYECVCTFSQDEMLATIYDIPSGQISTIVTNPKRFRAYPSPTKSYLAFLIRSNCKDSIVIFAAPSDSTRHHQTGLSSQASSLWRKEVEFKLQTNDAAEISWSPNEKYLVVKENILEYKVQIYSTLGYLQASFQIDSNPLSIDTALVTSQHSGVLGTLSESHRIAGGELGVREMKWSPDGRLLALGGHDDYVHILEDTEWSEAATLDLSRKVTAEETDSARMGPLMAWREPFAWQKDTGAHTIMPYDDVPTPLNVPTLRTDMSREHGVKGGVSWMEWNEDGTLLAIRCESRPAAVFIYAVPMVNREDADQRIYPYLLSVVMLSSSVLSSRWRPTRKEENTCSELAIITTQNGSIHIWRYSDGNQMVEAIPVPIDGFQPSDFLYAPDGRKMLVTASNETYCCAIEAEDDYRDMQESRL